MSINVFSKDRDLEVKEELQKKRKEISSFDELITFLKDVSDNYNVGYGGSVRAIGQAALATAWYIAKQFGITGFQASCVTWEFIGGWTNIGKYVGATILDYDDMLYPQHGYRFEKVMSQRVFEALQKRAKEKLESDQFGAAQSVVDHWQSIVDGNVPFGYTVENRDPAKSTTPIVERRYEAVSYFLAKNDKQLGVCLRMLFAEGLKGAVEVKKNDNGKIEFEIRANVDEQTMKVLLDRYEILIS